MEKSHDDHGKRTQEHDMNIYGIIILTAIVLEFILNTVADLLNLKALNSRNAVSSFNDLAEDNVGPKREIIRMEESLTSVFKFLIAKLG